MVKSGELKASIVIGRDHLDTGSVASPNRETESMKDGTDAAAACLANVLVNDCGSGVMRHADAGYELAIGTAKKQGLKLPMMG